MIQKKASDGIFEKASDVIQKKASGVIFEEVIILKAGVELIGGVIKWILNERRAR